MHYCVSTSDIIHFPFVQHVRIGQHASEEYTKWIFKSEGANEIKLSRFYSTLCSIFLFVQELGLHRFNRINTTGSQCPLFYDPPARAR